MDAVHYILPFLRPLFPDEKVVPSWHSIQVSGVTVYIADYMLSALEENVLIALEGFWIAKKLTCNGVRVQVIHR